MKKLLATTSLALIISSGAFAQDATQPAPAPATPAAPAEPMAPAESAAPGQVVMKDNLASAIIGESVYNSTAADASEIGEVKDIVIGSDGSATSLVVGVGGFLGIGEKNVAVDFKTAKWAEKDGDRWLVVETTKEQLEALPAFDAAMYAPAAPVPAAPATTEPAPAPAAEPAPATGTQPAPAPAPN